MLKTRFSNALAAASVLGILAAGAGVVTVDAQQRGAMRGRAFAQGQAPRVPGIAGFGLALRALGLTEDQRTQVRAILEQHRAETRAAAEKAAAARERMRVAETAPTLDEADLRAAAASLADAQVEAAIVRAKVRSEVEGLLTPEQRQKADEIRTRAQERLKQRAERLKARQQRRVR